MALLSSSFFFLVKGESRHEPKERVLPSLPDQQIDTQMPI
jgi:hypothetical protein